MPARIVRISTAPVKSLGLVHPDEVMLERSGVVGNRRFWLQDADGRLFNGKRGGTMVQIRPEWDEATRRLALVFPDGERVEATVEVGAEVGAEMHGYDVPSREVHGPWEEAISRFVGRPLRLLWADEGAVDRRSRGGAVSLVSRASLERLREEGRSTGAVDGRRFRMLFEIDGVEAHEEDEWIGNEIRIGEATIALNGDVGRCVVTSHDPDRGVTDFDTLGTLARYRPVGVTEPLPFGVYGAVATCGRVRLGDIASPLFSSASPREAAPS